jgi:hypothetical protein|tara:strand:- start:46 stop:693 length:648 start_codon:yes stop_codon:yes gene_type:complete
MTNQSAVNAAIAEAMAEIKTVSKNESNAHGNYNFASIDGFLGGCRDACHKNGLHPEISCINYEQYPGTNNKMWATYTYEMSMCHKSGEETKPVVTVVALPVTGAQTSGSAQSYALKQYLRGLFLIQTGEADDPDYNEPPELEQPPFNWDGWANERLVELKNINRFDMLEEFEKMHGGKFAEAQTQNPEIYATLGAAYQAKQKELEHGRETNIQEQ